MRFLRERTVLLAVGGGIAAYRACELSRLFVKAGAKVIVAMTPNATRFVTPLTFQALTGHPVLTDLFELRQDTAFGHLASGRAADLVVVAPASADLIARIRAGFADDAVTTSVLAARAPVLIAPAMNTAMWENPRTRENVAALQAETRYRFVGPASGLLADGDVGAGRLSEPSEILAAAHAMLAPQDLAGRRVIVTAGPTREHLDPVRFLSNPSTARMGFALAGAAAQRGAQVVLVSGPTELPAPLGVRLVPVVSAEELAAAVLSEVAGADLLVAAAAVADQRPKQRAAQKVKKTSASLALELEPTPDVLALASARVRESGARTLLVGFAAETEAIVAHAREKLERKGLDVICANDVTRPGSGFGSGTNRLTLVDRRGGLRELPELPKEEAAHAVLDHVLALDRGDDVQMAD